MARMIERLSPAFLARVKKPGLYGDGAGLYLHVGKAAKEQPPAGNGKPPKAGKPTGKSWVFRFMIQGRARTMGLGPLHTIGLSEARQLAREARKKCLLGSDPIEERGAARDARRREAAKAITFKACAEKFVTANRTGWKNAKHADQWTNTLTTYVYPVVGSLSVAAVETGHVTKILEPIWSAKPETAGRVRGRIESVLDYAAAHKWRDGENPARWRGHLENILPKLSKVRRVEHHAALPYRDLFEFMKQLREEGGTAARALEFAILGAARTGEVIGAKWDEMDLGAKLWVIPGDRMKAGKEHRVPLSERAVMILKAMEKLRDADEPGYVFPGGKKGKPLSNMAMLKRLKDMGRDDLTAHGFRSTFRDWAAERTSYPSEVAEMALAHTVGAKVEQAYRRTDLFEKRKRLMADWAAFCSIPFVAAEDANVVTLRGAAQ